MKTAVLVWCRHPPRVRPQDGAGPSFRRLPPAQRRRPRPPRLGDVRTPSGRACEGHIFWDVDVFTLPFYLHTAPDVARTLLMYRHHTPEGARWRARKLGYRGACYAWGSTVTGRDATPWNIVLKRSGSPARSTSRFCRRRTKIFAPGAVARPVQHHRQPFTGYPCRVHERHLAGAGVRFPRRAVHG